jgi:hypothetical protein
VGRRHCLGGGKFWAARWSSVWFGWRVFLLKLKIWCFCCKQFLCNFYSFAEVSFFYWVAENIMFSATTEEKLFSIFLTT